METMVSGAAHTAAEVARIDARLRADADLLADLLHPRKRRDTARLNQLLLGMNHMVHAGFRVVATGGQAKAADMAAAGSDMDARGRVQAEWVPVGRALHRLQLALVKWPMIQSMVRPQIARKRRPLFEDTTALPDIVRTREAVSDRLFAELHDLINTTEQDAGAEAHGCFADIPLAQSLFLKEAHAAMRILRALRPGETTRFLDVGCGAGLKVISAARYFDRAVGLEFDPGYAARARLLFGDLHHDRCRVIEGDALTFERYHDYDVIYFFRPLRDDAMLARMEQRVLDQARPMTLIIAPYRIFEDRLAGYDCVHLAGHVFLTGATDAQARRLRRDAELIGPDVPLGPDANVPVLWDRLVAASRRNGFEARLTSLPVNKDVNA